MIDEKKIIARFQKVVNEFIEKRMEDTKMLQEVYMGDEKKYHEMYNKLVGYEKEIHEKNQKRIKIFLTG